MPPFYLAEVEGFVAPEDRRHKRLAEGVEVPAAPLRALVAYVAALPAPRPAGDGDGAALFRDTGCAACHIPTLAEAEGRPVPAFTDLLLHDLGPGLAGGFPEGRASAAEWRTAPLWNIGHTAGVNQSGEAYLHDGRARTLEEAILWHGGEAEASKESFRQMSAADRAALIAFLKSL